MALTVSNDTLVGALPFLQKMLASAQPAPAPAPPPSDAPVVDMSDQRKTSVLPFIQKQIMGGGDPLQPQPDTSFRAAPMDLSRPPEDVPPAPGPVARDLSTVNLPSDSPSVHVAQETKGHKLLRILQAGIQGGIAGQEANAQTYAATGRNGGFGVGLGAGYQAPSALPFIKAQRDLAIQKDQAQVNLLKNTVTVRDPYGNVYQIPQGQLPGFLKTTIPEQGRNDRSKAKIESSERLAGAKNSIAAWKPEGATGTLRNVLTGETLTPNAGGMVKVPADIADAMGVEAGTMMPAKQIVTARNAAYGHMAAADPIITAQIGQPPVGDPQALAEWGQKAEAIHTRMGVAPRIEMTLSRPVQVAETDADGNPTGKVTYQRAGDAMSSGAMAPGSVPFQAEKAVAKKATSGNWADQKIAFNTAIQHAELLRDAAKALNNGDVRVLNSLSNQAKNQFGDPDLTNFQAIANAYNHEITSVISKGHITDNEVKSGDRTLPADANYETIDKVLKSYQALAQSKMTQLQKQIDQGMKGNAGNEHPAGGKEIHYKIVNGQLVQQ